MGKQMGVTQGQLVHISKLVDKIKKQHESKNPKEKRERGQEKP